jgi:hypothetical protein
MSSLRNCVDWRRVRNSVMLGNNSLGLPSKSIRMDMVSLSKKVKRGDCWQYIP